jgi:hypothetical protein
MRYFFAIALFLFCLPVFAQSADSKSLNKAVEELDKALIGKDSVSLKKLLNDDLSYGHSNGWIEKKSDVIKDLFNGKLTYKQIDPKIDEIYKEGNTASVRITANLDIVFNDKPLQLKLHILQVWTWKNKHWQLFARQSVKI